jgi:hypothetical protein
MSDINNNKPGQSHGQQNNAQRPGTPSANSNSNSNRGTQQPGQKGPQGGTTHTNKDDRKK